MVARFESGTFERIDNVRDEDETRTDFLRAATEREIALRERQQQRKTR
jgi:hypothetical protein